MASVRRPRRGGPERPRCLHVIPETREGGAESQARYLLAGLRDSGAVDPELVFFARGVQHADFEQLGIPTGEVARRRRLLLDLIPRARRLRRKFAARPPELLHTWLLEGNLVGLLAARAWATTRVIVTERSGIGEKDFPNHLRLQRLLRRRVDAAISNSNAGLSVLHELGIPSERTWLIGNAVPADQVATALDRSDARLVLGVGATAKVVLWVGRADDAYTVRLKGLDLLLAAIGQIRVVRPEVELVLVGPTPERLVWAGIDLPDWAYAVGWQRHPIRIMNAADVVAVSSRSEANSNVALEALLLGLPVVSTACGEHASLVETAHGLLVPANDPSALAAALAQALEAPPKRELVASAARPALSIDRIVADTLAVYRAVLDQAPVESCHAAT